MSASPSTDDRHGHGSSVVLKPDVEGALHDAALVVLLDHVAQPLNLLGRIRVELARLHARHRTDGESLPPEYWFWSP